MVLNTKIKHIGLQCSDREKTKIFFTEILGLPYKKSNIISKKLLKSIFNINENTIVDYYGDNKTIFEIFIKEKSNIKNFDHICIEIKNKNEFIKKCKKYNIYILYVNKEEKKLLFIRDFSDNLFEIKFKE